MKSTRKKKPETEIVTFRMTKGEMKNLKEAIHLLQAPSASEAIRQSLRIITTDYQRRITFVKD